jgi:GNAT superfamily N-acetyltransferase
MTDLAAIERYLRRAPYLHAYELGDMDPREADHVTWIARDPVDAVVLVYRGLATPTIVALSDDDPEAATSLLASIADDLPERIYAHLSPGVEAALADRYQLDLLGHCRKMALTAPVAAAPDGEVLRLGPEHADEATRFFAAAYPDSVFAPAILARAPHLAIRDDRGIAAVAGAHVYSPVMRIASLGNIATRPDARGRGLARRVTAAMCRLLQPEVDVIGLNVRANNSAAIATYQRLGFEIRHAYGEWRGTARPA